MLASIERITAELNLTYACDDGYWWLYDDTRAVMREFCASSPEAFLAGLRRLATEPMALPVEQLRHDLYGCISDASKDAQGFRARFDISGYTTADLMRECEYWSDQAFRAIERERQEQAEAVAVFERRVADTIALGAGDRDTAVRWLMDAEVDPQDYDRDGYFKWLNNIPCGYDLQTGERV